MSPKKIIFMMMRSYPRDYPSRLTALMKMFDNPAMHWHNGELVFIDEIHTSSLAIEYESESRALKEARAGFIALESKGDGADEFDFNEARSAYLSELKAQNEQAFVFHNAHLLSQDTRGRFSINPNFNGLHFYDIPLDVTPEWLSAAIELATAIYNHTLIPAIHFKSDEHIVLSDRLKQSKSHAKRLLINLDVIELGFSEREALIDNLVRDAQSLWMSDDIIRGINAYRKPHKQKIKPT